MESLEFKKFPGLMVLERTRKLSSFSDITTSYRVRHCLATVPPVKASLQKRPPISIMNEYMSILDSLLLWIELLAIGLCTFTGFDKLSLLGIRHSSLAVVGSVAACGGVARCSSLRGARVLRAGCFGV